MASSPRFKVYAMMYGDTKPEYIGSVKYLTHAAMLVAGLGDGATIRDGHTTIIWTEGAEDFPAFESYDGLADIALQRIREARMKRLRRPGGNELARA